MPAFIFIMRRLFLFFIFCFFIYSVPVSVQAKEPSILQQMRYSAASDKIRIVLEFDNLPDSHLFFSSLPKASCELVLNGCVTGKNLKTLIEDRKDPLFVSLAAQKRGSASVSVTASLMYPLPESNIRLTSLGGESPKRLVIDIYRDFSFKSSLPVADGIKLDSEEFSDKNGYVRYCDLCASVFPAGKAYLDVVMAAGKGRQTVGEIRRNAPNAAAAVNGGFFAWEGGAPLGLVYRYGKVIAPNVSRRPVRSAFGVRMDGSAFVDRVSAASGKIYDSYGTEISNAAFVLGGGPRLVLDGIRSVNADEEELGKKGNDITGIAGRTAVGIGADGSIHLVTATGWNDSHSEGLKLEPFADRLISSGIVSAVNLDGGGSSAMDVAGTDVSKPAGRKIYSRPVGNALCLMTQENLLMPYSVSDFKASKDDIAADGKDTALCSFSIKDALGNSLPDGTKVKITPSCGGFPFYAESSGGVVSFSFGKQKKAASFSVFAECGALQAEIWKGRLVAGEPSEFFCELIPDDSKYPDYFRASFSCEDSFGNRVSGRGFSFIVVDTSGEKLFDKTVRLSSSSASVIFIDKSLAGRKVSVMSFGNEVFSFSLPEASKPEESTDDSPSGSSVDQPSSDAEKGDAVSPSEGLSGEHEKK